MLLFPKRQHLGCTFLNKLNYKDTINKPFLNFVHLNIARGYEETLSETGESGSGGEAGRDGGVEGEGASQ